MEELPFILVFVSLSTLCLFPQLLLPLSLASHDLIVLCLGWCCSLPVLVTERFLAFLIPLAYSFLAVLENFGPLFLLVLFLSQ